MPKPETQFSEAVPAQGEKVLEPDELICPITHVMFRDPAFVADSGNTYERYAIEMHWWLRGRPHDPLTNLELPYSAPLFTNWDKRRSVLKFLEEHPEPYLPDGWEDRALPAPRQTPQRAARLICSLVSAARAFTFSTSGLAVFFGLLGFMLPAASNQLIEWRCQMTMAEVGESAAGLVGLMREYPTHACLQKTAILALTRMSLAGEENRSSIVEAGGARQLVSAMRTAQWDYSYVFPHANCASVVRAVACHSLGSLLFSEQAAAVIYAGGIYQIISTMRTSAPLSDEDAGACYATEAACWALKKVEFLRQGDVALLRKMLDQARVRTICRRARVCERPPSLRDIQRWLRALPPRLKATWLNGTGLSSALS